MMFNGSVEYARRGFCQENGLSKDNSSDELADVCCGDSSEQQKQSDSVVPDAPVFDPTSLSAPSTFGIVRDSSCTATATGTGTSDYDITPKQIERWSQQGWGSNSTRVKNHAGLNTPAFEFRPTRDIITATQAKMETKTETTPFCFASADRQFDLQITKSYFINTLCDALNIDRSELRDRIRTLTSADARNVILKAVTIKPCTTEPRTLDPEEREFILTKFIAELNIPWDIASMFRRRTMSRELFIAMTQHARPKDVSTIENSTDARHVATGVEFLPGVYTRYEKRKITNPAEDGSIRVTCSDDPNPNPELVEQSNKNVEYDEMLRTGMNAYARLKAFDHLPLGSNGSLLSWSVFWQGYKTGQKARDVAERARKAIRQWPTGEDICSLPSLDDVRSRRTDELLEPSFENCRPTFTHLSPVDPVTGKRTQLNRPREFANAQIFRAEPAMCDTVSKPGDFDFGSSIQKTIQRGLDSAAKCCGPIVSRSSASAIDSWNRGTVSPPFPEAVDVSLSTFANQISSALRVLPFPPKEVTFSMTLKV